MFWRNKRKIDFFRDYLPILDTLWKSLLNISKPSKELVRTRKDYVIGREITTILKIAVDNAILELCDSCDFFASPLLKGKKN